MTGDEVTTITKDRTLTDLVRESPVDQYEYRFRRKISLVVLGIVLLLALTV